MIYFATFGGKAPGNPEPAPMREAVDERAFPQPHFRNAMAKDDRRDDRAAGTVHSGLAYPD